MTRWETCLAAEEVCSSWTACRAEFEHVTALSTRVPDGSRGKLDDGVRGQTCRKTPRRHTAPNLQDAVLAVKVHKVNGKLHAEGVHRLTRYDPHSITRGKALAPQQA